MLQDFYANYKKTILLIGGILLLAAVAFGALQLMAPKEVDITLPGSEAFDEEGILDCSPDNQNAFVGQSVSFSVTVLQGPAYTERTFAWEAIGGNPQNATGVGLTSFATTYYAPGQYVVRVGSGTPDNDTSYCQV